jgi:hypothetical protein
LIVSQVKKGPCYLHMHATFVQLLPRICCGVPIGQSQANPGGRKTTFSFLEKWKPTIYEWQHPTETYSYQFFLSQANPGGRKTTFSFLVKWKPTIYERQTQVVGTPTFLFSWNGSEAYHLRMTASNRDVLLSVLFMDRASTTIGLGSFVQKSGLFDAKPRQALISSFVDRQSS